MSISQDGNEYRFEDNYSDNAMLTMLSEFVNSLNKDVPFTNIDLAISVTTTLAELSNYSK
jgi:hypothetical protein